MINTDNDNPDLKLALGFLQGTAENVFLTGKAGTGKTTFLHNLKKNSPKRMIVLAPTGVAAINAGGVTIHSFFQMPFGPCIPGGGAKTVSDGQSGIKSSAVYHKFSREKLNIIRSLDLIVIDEISMVRADLLDGIDEQLRRLRNNSSPFGGVQLLMIGDLQQLAPVVKDDEWEILKQYYDTPFFFGSKALNDSKYVTIELKRIYRQSDQQFIDLLNRVRYGDKDPATLAQLNRRYQPGFSAESEGYITLTTHNYQAKEINEQKMRKLAGIPHMFKAQIEGEFPEYSFPTDPELEIKAGAQVMFVKNDSSQEKRFFNGKIGNVQKIEGDIIYVNCQSDNEWIMVKREIWQNSKYGLNHETGEIMETVIGTFTQYPLKAAWAITIHKSQGLTFDKVIIDAGAAFAHGQVYVALSRCRTLEGLILTSPLSPRVLINDSSVDQFTRNIQKKLPGESQLKEANIAYQQVLLRDLFDFSSIHRQINYFLKLVNQNRESILASIADNLGTLAAAVKSEICEIAEKFNTQIISLLAVEPDVEQNEPLKERITKAVPYFIQKTETNICSFLQAGNDIVIDNKDTRKAFTDCLKRLNDEQNRKIACLEACREGFTVKVFLETRSRAAIEKVAEKKFQSPDVALSPDSHPDLYQKLRAWRARKAADQDFPEYMIMHNKTIIEICTRLPCTLEELKCVKGLGKRKLKEFGEQILELVSCYCKDNNVCYTARTKPFEELQPEIKLNTKQVTLDLFRSGKTLADIAAHRNLTLSTIEGHIAHFISSGELEIELFLSPEKVSLISDYFMTHDNKGLSPAKDHFGEEISYGELRMVVAHLSYAETLL